MTFSRYKVERKFVRYSLDVRAKVISGEEEIRVRTLDISEGGVGLVSPVEILKRDSLVVEFEFPTSEGVFRAEVGAQSRVGFRYGFSFVEVDESSMALLRKYQRRWGVLAKENYAARD
jgi:c-di-GMP-binding flagellar brake protein YcgR